MSQNERKGRTNISSIANHLVLNLLPALHTSFDEHLRGKREAARGKITKFFRIVGETGAESAECKGRAHNDWIPYFFGGTQGCVDG